MRRISWLAAAALVVVGVGAVVLVVLDPGAGKASTTQYITTAARQTNVVKSAVATGTVQATQTYALAFGSDPQIVTSASSGSGSSGSGSSGSGGSTITWLVKSVSASVGQKVTKGEVLASADPGDAQAQLAAAQAQLAAAQAKLTADQAGATTTQKQTASGQVTSAQNQLANARTSLANTQAQNALSLSQSQAAVTRAQAQLDTDTANSAPQNVLTQDQNALQQARDSLASTQLKVQASNTQAAQQVTSAQLALSQAQASYTAAIAPAATAQIASDQAGVASAQASVTSAQARVDAATLHAPVDGVVSAVTIQPGFDAPSGAAIDVQSSGMQIVAAFTETDLPSLAVGQAADVAINATGQQTTGKVASITPTAATAGSGTSVVTYNVDVSLDEVPPGTSAGMTAQVSVTTASVAGAIAVPPIAISGTSGNYSVQVLDSSGQVHAQSVQVGLIGSDLAQITSGLNAVDRVVIGSSSQRQGTTTTGFGGLGGGNVRGLTGGGGGFGGGNFGGNGGNRGTTP
ncbi:MAG TPA: HlyD family efflux transporter periplasmic adaptor subunit [Candidatus Dormibacteraeota bacterium]|nr:HlyD family efflux transporter periplasmic adaptor subunit [Candidatus Dormibacteraeota bacterium]